MTRRAQFAVPCGGDQRQGLYRRGRCPHRRRHAWPGRDRLARRDDLLQFFGHFHGGIITALADQAAGIAVTSGLPRGKIGVTVELKVNFLSAADGLELIARAKTLKMSGSLGVATVEVFSKKDSAETLCAFCTATMRALDLPREFQPS